jgi:hypothetical protein
LKGQGIIFSDSGDKAEAAMGLGERMVQPESGLKFALGIAYLTPVQEVEPV